MEEKRKFAVGDVVLDRKDPVIPYEQRKKTYTVTRVYEDHYEALGLRGMYLDIPFADEADWELDAVPWCCDREANKITIHDVVTEHLSFEYVPEGEDDWMDVPYRLQLGDRYMESCISEWSVDYGQIRHDLEHLIYHRETSIELHFEDSPTVIRLIKAIVLDPDKERIYGTGFCWTDLLRVEIYPDSFVCRKYPPFFGYVLYEEALRALYDGLMDALRAYPDVNDEYPDVNRKAMYEQLHSPKLESYLNRLKNKK